MDEKFRDYFYWYLVIVFKIVFVVGLKMGYGMFINIVILEENDDFLFYFEIFISKEKGESKFF